METQSARAGEAVYRPPEIQRAGCANIRPFGGTTKADIQKVIKLPKRAQRDLRYLKRRLIAGYCASRYTLEFVHGCFMEFPALVKA